MSLTTTSFWLPAKSEPVPHPGTADSHIPCDLGDPVDPEYTVQFRHPGYGHTVLEPCPQRTHPSLTSALVHPFGTRPCYIPSDVTLSLSIYKYGSSFPVLTLAGIPHSAALRRTRGYSLWRTHAAGAGRHVGQTRGVVWLGNNVARSDSLLLANSSSGADDFARRSANWLSQLPPAQDCMDAVSSKCRRLQRY